MPYAHHTEANVSVSDPPAEVFAFLDDQEALGEHMTKASAMMAGGHMTYEFDEERGRAVGSVIRLRGQMLGLTLRVEEVVTERVPPKRKVLETRGDQHMLVIGAYRLGFELDAAGGATAVSVFIDYDLPAGLFAIFARLPAYFYARWCVIRMADAAVERFHAAQKN
jgi:carbon monoxide dehydrogenase subunit G